MAENPEKDYVLQNDLDLKGATWTPIPSFSGTFYGKSHTISNLVIQGNNQFWGFFGQTTADSIVNSLNLRNVSLTATGNAMYIGLIAGLVAHKIFRISRQKDRKIPLSVATVISCSAGMFFNIIADPLVGYFYKMYLMGIPQDAATILAKMSAVTTSVNAVIAVIAASIFYLALRPVLNRSNKLPQI